MAAFEYEALDPTGRQVKGVISADSPRLARRELRRKNLFPTRLAPASAKGGPAPGKLKELLPDLGGMGPKDRALVTRQLATLISAAAPVEEALHSVAMQAEKPAIRRTLMAVRASVTEGLRLSQAMGQHSKDFDQLYCAMVAAGESSGTLGPVLERLADHLEKRQKIRAMVIGALVYPGLITCMSVSVIIVMMAFVVPKFVEQFASLDQELPLITQILIGVSEAVRTFGLLFAVAGLAGLFAFGRAMRYTAFRSRVDRALLRLPVIGKLTRQLLAARLARTLAALVASGTPVLEGLQAARNTVSNTVLQGAVRDVITQVREGAGLSAALRRAGAFPPLVVYMTAMGEKSGNLAPMLERAADYLESEFEGFTNVALKALEPAILIVMGGVVTFIVLAIFLPILQLNTLGLSG